MSEISSFFEPIVPLDYFSAQSKVFFKMNSTKESGSNLNRFPTSPWRIFKLILPAENSPYRFCYSTFVILPLVCPIFFIATIKTCITLIYIFVRNYKLINDFKRLTFMAICGSLFMINVVMYFFNSKFSGDWKLIKIKKL